MLCVQPVFFKIAQCVSHISVRERPNIFALVNRSLRPGSHEQINATLFLAGIAKVTRRETLFEQQQETEPFKPGAAKLVVWKRTSCNIELSVSRVESSAKMRD